MPTTSSIRKVRHRCRQLIDGLEIRSPFDLDAFIDSLAVQRGKAIVLVPKDTVGQSPCGLWFCYPHTDYIVYEASATPTHRQAIVLHEVGHMFCDHDPVWGGNGDLLESLTPELGADQRVRIMARSGYSNAEELQAEVFSSLALARIGAARPADPRPDAGAALRITQSLSAGTHRIAS